MDAQPALKDQIVQRLDPGTGTALLFRACSSCRHLTVPTDDTRKMCRKCRNKSNERARKKAQERAQEKASLASYNYADGNTQQPKVAHADPNLKRKSETTLRELEGEEQRHTIKKLRVSINNAADKAKAAPEQRRSNTAHTEYQKASALYDAIKYIPTGRRFCNFAGCHSIVKSESIGHQKRAQMVIKDLRKIVKFPFKYDIPLKTSSNKIRARFTYSCACKSFVPKTLSSLTNTSGWKSFGPASAAAGNANIGTTETGCGGSVVVTVRNDDSHPLGIPGQQIIVEIIH